MLPRGVSDVLNVKVLLPSTSDRTVLQVTRKALVLVSSPISMLPRVLKTAWF